jgi:hypothetical protein
LFGKRGVRRVVAVDPRLRVEVSFEAPTTLLGLQGSTSARMYRPRVPIRPWKAKAKACLRHRTGELATWKGIGNGHYLADGSVSYRGALTFSSSSPKLSRLNAVAGAFEFEVAADGHDQGPHLGVEVSRRV